MKNLILFLFLFIGNIFQYLFATSSSPPSYFNIGMMFALEINGAVSPNLPFFHAVLKAFNDINNKNDGVLDDILPDTELRIIHRSANYQFLRGAIKAGEILSTDPQKAPVMACVGPVNYDTIRGAVPALQEAGGIPVINYRDRTAIFGRSDLYPNLFRPIPASYKDGQITAALVSKYFRWDKVTIFYQSTDSSRLSAQVFRHYAQEYGINILSAHILDSSSQDYSADINDAKGVGSRIFVIFLAPSVGVKLITQGQELKLFNGKTQIIGGEELTTSSSWAALKLSSETLNTLLNGYIGVIYHPYAPPSQMKTKFLLDSVNQKSTKGYVDSNGVSHCDTRMDYYNTSYLYQYYPGLDTTKPLKCAGLNYSSYKKSLNTGSELDAVLFGYDSVLSVAYGLHHLIYNLNNTNPTPADLRSILLSKKFSFIGLTGKVSYSTELEKDQLDVGARLTGLIYDVVNYVPFDINPTSPPTSPPSKIIFKPIVKWNSETGFPDCNNHTHYVPDGHDNEPSCVSFQFQTKENTLPYDSAPPVIEHVPDSFISALFFLSSIGILAVLFIGYISFCYRRRRLVKMSQPTLSYMMLLGMLLGFVRVFISARDPNSDICRTRLWLEHFAFQLIFGTLVVRSLRVYLVACTMKRTKVTEKQCIMLVLLSMVITIGFLITLMVSDDRNSAIVTVTENQFEYILQHTCDYDARNLINGLYIYDLLILFIGLVLCWLIRNVKSAVSNTSVLLEVLITTSTISIVMYIVLSMIKFEPNTRLFIVGLVISLTLLRLLWVFYSPLIYNIFMGYELDRSLTLRKSEKNVLQSLGCGKLSNTIFAANDDAPVCALGNKINGEPTSAAASSNVDYQTMKQLEKFRKLKNRDELNHEMIRVKEEIQKYQVELGCLENMMFAASQEDSNSNLNSQSKGSRNESGLQSNHNLHNRYSVESGVGNQSYNGNQEGNCVLSECRDECGDQYVDLEKKLQSTSPSRMNSDYPGDTAASVKSPVSTIV